MAIRHYTLRLTTRGPVHIGCGKMLGKRDYFAKGSSIAVLDAKKFVGGLDSRQLEEYVKFLSDSDFRATLQDFLDRHQDIRSIAEASVAYTIDSKLSRAGGGSYQYHDVAEFVKDACGNPYVPGSSVKGMLRTAILASYLDAHQNEFKHLYDAKLAQEYNERALVRDCSAIEHAVFFREHPDAGDTKLSNDIMRYISIADSSPLSSDDLVFAKKFDRFSKLDDGSHKKDLGRVSDEEYWMGNSLDVYRECIRPGVQIEFAIDIDERADAYIGKVDTAGLLSMLKRANELYEERFLDNFDFHEDASLSNPSTSVGDGKCQYVYESGPLKGRRCRNRAVEGQPYCNVHKDKLAASSSSSKTKVSCYLGGGVGFSSKTVVHALLTDDSERVDAIARTLYDQFPTKIDRSRHSGLWSDVQEAGFEPQFMKAKVNRKNGRLQKAKDDHRHWMDPELGVSPHTVKLAVVGGKKYLMGACDVEIEEL